MPGTTIEGKNCKLALSTTKVLGIGNWKYSPGEVNELDDTEFGDTTEKIKLGIRKRGTISFEGIAKKGDTTGQEVLKAAMVNAADITTLRLYEDNTSYYEPCQTTGYFSPANTSGNATQKTVVNVTKFDVSVEKNGLAKISMTATVSGDMVEV